MIWLIGNRGMLGTEVELLLKRQHISYTATDMECDITNPAELTHFAQDKKIDWIINCSAYTAVDKAEDEHERAFQINAQGVQNIAEVAAGCNASLIHISTDYVFSGDKEKPYTEEDEPNPQSAYGQSKLAGEQLLVQRCKNYFILRTAWLYGRYGNNFVKTILHKFRTDPEVKIVDDQQGSPTLASDLAEAIIKIVQQKSSQYGIYHAANSGSTTWFRFAQEIHTQATGLNMIPKKVALIPISSEAYITKAKRPKNSVLASDKLKNNLGISLRTWQTALKFYLENEVAHAAKT